MILDYAHSPDALENVLTTVRAFTRSRLIVLFGCGGDRDAGKRPVMGGIAVRLADEVVVTSDNPRTEDPDAIIADISAGAPGARVVTDRAEAIHHAVAEADGADVVLIAGKGHEDYQEINGVKHHFSDSEVVRAAMNVLAGEAGPRTFILGDMGEIGDSAEEAHREAGEYARSLGIDALYACGPLSRHAAEAFGEGGRWFETRDALIEALKGLRGTATVKASHFMGFAAVVRALQDNEE